MSYEVQLFTDPETLQPVVLASDYAALAASHEKLVEALKAAQEELRLIRMKDSNAVYDPILRTATIPLALAEAEKLTKET